MTYLRPGTKSGANPATNPEGRLQRRFGWASRRPSGPANGISHAGLLPSGTVFQPRVYEGNIEGVVEKLVTTGIPRSLQSQPGPSTQDVTVRRVTVQTLC